MRETKFIEQNKEKWSEFEHMIKNDDQDPERLNALFIQITDDLSYARTYYPNRSVRIYLNNLAQRVFHNVYRGKRFPIERLKNYWAHDLPRLMWEERRLLWFAFAIFALAFAIGLISSIIHPDFPRVILGDSYVDMTLKNIENGDPMAVYKESMPFGMTLSIAFNNLRVALMTAVFGILAGLGTVLIIMYNGIMVGSFQYFFIEKGLFKESFLTIWIHGTLEISTIIIAGAAGMVAGSGLLFPGTYTRAQAFQRSIRRAMSIFFGVSPLIILAAIFEGYLTRFTDTPDVIRAIFILISFVFVCWYFVWLPWFKAKRGDFYTKETSEELPPNQHFQVLFTTVKTGGEVLTEAFNIFKKHHRFLFGICLGAIAVVMSYLYGISDEPVSDVLAPDFGAVSNLKTTSLFFKNSTVPGLFYLQAFIMAALGIASLLIVEREMPEDLQPAHHWGSILLRWLVLALPALCFPVFLKISPGFFGWLTAMSVFPLLSMWVAVIFIEQANPIMALVRALGLIRWSQAIVLGMIGVNLCFLVFLFLETPIWAYIIQLFSWLVPADPADQAAYTSLINTFASLMVCYVCYILFILSGVLLYFSSMEVSEATGLKNGIEQIGSNRKIRGLARE